jgi:DNA-directed RNA polymerase specialized sigma subunit
MEKERVIEVLIFYKNIEKEIELNKRIIRNLEEQYYSSVGAINMDGMPKAKGGISSPTEAIALNVPNTVRESISEIEEGNNQLHRLKAEILKEINKLPYIYKSIVFDFYINNFQCVRISEQINYSERQCNNIRNCALEKLKKEFDKNRVISNFNFPQ